MKILVTLFIVCQFYLFKLLTVDPVERLDRNVEITRLTDNVYSMKSSFAGDGNLNCNHMLIFDNNDVVLVNTPVNDSLTVVMLNCLEKRFKKPVTKVIVSHFHEDSSGGLLETARRRIVSYGQDKTRKLLEPKGKKIDITFSDSLVLPLKTEIIELLYFGGGHSRDNIVVWLPKEKILFGGCMLKSLSAKDKGNTKDADMDSWANTVRKVKERFKDAKIVIPGHMESGDTSIFEHTINLVRIK